MELVRAASHRYASRRFAAPRHATQRFFLQRSYQAMPQFTRRFRLENQGYYGRFQVEAAKWS